MGCASGELEWLRRPEGHGVAGALSIVNPGSLFAREVGAISNKGRVGERGFPVRDGGVHDHMRASEDGKAENDCGCCELHVDGFFRA